jgi:hypothetical protein
MDSPPAYSTPERVESPYRAFLVLPPGTGKTHIMGSTIGKMNPFLLDMDVLVNYRTIPSLYLKRQEAKRTNQWEEYDKEMARLLHKAINDTVGEMTPALVMVPAKSIGTALGYRWYGNVLLSVACWTKALAIRSGKTEVKRHHAVAYEKASNDAIIGVGHAQVMEIVDLFCLKFQLSTAHA